jgi:hypothetical protein|tara:strand:- start:2048 stop:2533 length:486 start_codon:yes stop_codon:yes gene_type:complete
MERNITPHLKKIVNDIEKILNRIPHDLKNKGGFYVDHYMEECLESVDRINELQNVTIRQKLKAKKRIFEVYFKLQEYKGPHIAHHNNQRIIYAGGLGYASVSKAVLTERLGKAVDHYWKPTKKRKCLQLDISMVICKFKQTTEEWKLDMAKQKKNILNEVH